MAEPGDETAAGMRGHSSRRASNADREQVIDVLKAAFTQGRLTKDEFDLRVGQALAARSYADLARLTTDIPAGLIGALQTESIGVSSHRNALSRGRRIDVLIGLAVVAASIVMAAVIHRPDIHCSYLNSGPPPRGCITSDYPMMLRYGIVVAGFTVAGLIIAISRYPHRAAEKSGSHRPVATTAKRGRD